MIQTIPPLKNTQFAPSVYWEGFLSEEEIKTILALPEWNQGFQAEVGSINGNILDKNVRASTITWLDKTEKTQWLYERIANVIAQVNNDYFRFDISGIKDNLQLSVYDEADLGHYNWHIDSEDKTSMYNRKISFTLLLSDPSEFEGGNLEIKYDSDNPIPLQQAKGRAWLFPSYLLHRVSPVTKGTRKTLVVWASGTSFR